MIYSADNSSAGRELGSYSLNEAKVNIAWEAT
jgi:hypothetical protein